MNTQTHANSRLNQKGLSSEPHTPERRPARYLTANAPIAT